MPENLTDYGVAVVVIYVVLQLVFGFLGKRGKNGDSNKLSEVHEMMRGLVRESKDIHRWHAPDAEGQQLWKNPAVARLLEKLNENIEAQTRLLERLSADVGYVRRKAEDS